MSSSNKDNREKLDTYQIRRQISIHVPHTRYDFSKPVWVLTPINFNPRTSYEVRQKLVYSLKKSRDFNPRTSYEVRLFNLSCRCNFYYFNPRTSYEVRQHVWLEVDDYTPISIHVPHTRYDFESTVEYR